jgi:hypothetical protein
MKQRGSWKVLVKILNLHAHETDSQQRFERASANISLFLETKTGCAAHTATYSMYTAFFPGN